jgi:RNA polymerase sigma-70 factor (ECF subfamily)
MGLVRIDDVDLAELMAAAQAGNGHAYEDLLQAVAEISRRIIRRRLGSMRTDEVDDLVQEVLLSVHAVRATYDPRRPFLPWLYAIVRNRVADRARVHGRSTAHEIVVDDLDVTFAAADTNLSGEEYGDREALRDAIATLPRGQREAIELLKLKGLSLKEAATATGTSVGALKIATHRAMTTLRRMLAPHDLKH